MGDGFAPSTTAPARTLSERLCADEDLHHGSHRRLLRTHGAEATPREVDAIIVPTARAVDQLGHVMAIARELSCMVVALCSKRADAASSVALGREVGARVIAFDI